MGKKASMVEESVAHFLSSLRVYQYIEQRWAALSEEARREQSQSSLVLRKEFDTAGEHKAYLDYVRDSALQISMNLRQSQESLDARVKQLQKERAEEEALRKEQQKEEEDNQHMKDKEIEEKALNLMQEGRDDIQLGRNIAAMKELSTPNTKAKPSRGNKKFNPDVQISAGAIEDGAVEGEEGEAPAPARGRSQSKAKARPKRMSKKEKKKAKKEAKKRKKDKKRKRGDED